MIPFSSPLPLIRRTSLASTTTTTTTIFRTPFMAAHPHHQQFDSQETHLNKKPILLENYPVPLSPPLPFISKDIELNRAMSASSKSSLFTLNKSDVLFEDEWLIAFNKPQGVYCETILASVPTLLLNNSPELGIQAKKMELHLANRLDRDTSGVILITKSHKVAAKLVKAFTDHKVRKTYIAFCIGKHPKWKKMTLKSGHGRSKFGAWRVYAAKDVGRKLPGGSSVKDMETLFEVLSVNGEECTENMSELNVVVEDKSLIEFECEGDKGEILVRAYPRSGRTHQIRLHCQYLGIPVRGDVKYEGVYEWNGTVYDGHELHAESLTFDHPVTGSSIVIHAPLPSWANKGVELAF